MRVSRKMFLSLLTVRNFPCPSSCVLLPEILGHFLSHEFIVMDDGCPYVREIVTFRINIRKKHLLERYTNPFS